MAEELRCSDLGVAGCEYVARAATPHEVVEDMVKHLRKNHDIDMPDAEEIMSGDYDETTGLGDALDEEARLVVKRMRETLDIEGLEDDSPDFGLVEQRGPSSWD
jgi:predicted small metal-binding protein